MGTPDFWSGVLHFMAHNADFCYNMGVMLTNTSRLKEIAKTVRYLILRSTTEAGSGHPSSSLSAADLMTVLLFGGYFHTHLDDPGNVNNDRLLFSKGHAAPLLYSLYTVAHQIDEDELLKLRKFNSPLEGHPTMSFPFTEAATGSLGQGLSVGLGMALNAMYVDNLSYNTYVLLGDSEMAEGSVWETIQLAAYYKTSNLVGIVDVNGLGQRGETMYGHRVKEYETRLKAFGWKTIVVDGHNLKQIAKAFEAASKERKRPTMIIAKTVKGKGVKFIENKEGWHGKALSKEECEKAVQGLGNVNPSLRGVIFKPKDEEPAEFEGEKQLIKPNYKMGELISTREAYGEALVGLFPKMKNMVVLDAEVSNSSGAHTFNEHYPERFFEMFIAEQNMIGTALGFSRMGKIPFVSTFAAFLIRAADQIRMSQYSKSNIKFVGSHCGVSIGQDGVSQMGLEDIALFRAQHGSVVLYPADAVATHKLLWEAGKHLGNVYLRTTREKLPVIYKEQEEFHIGGSKVWKNGDRDEVTVIAVGITLFEALKAQEALFEEGIFIRVVDMYSIKPIDKEMLLSAVLETKAIVTVEDHYEEGGLGEAVRSEIDKLKLSSGYRPVVKSLCVRKMPRSGRPEELLAYEEIDAVGIVRAVKEVIGARIAEMISV